MVSVSRIETLHLVSLHIIETCEKLATFVTFSGEVLNDWQNIEEVDTFVEKGQTY